MALCELDAERLVSLSQKYGVSETYQNLDEALKHQFDGVIICTPNFLHKNDLEKCIKAGLNVMLEKPMSESVESAKKMYKLCEQYNRFAFIAYCLRFAPPYIKIKELITSGFLGKVFSICASVAGKKAITDSRTDYRTKKNLGGGVISDFSHEIDYSIWFAGQDVKTVRCYGSNAVHKDWDVLDTAELIIACYDDINISVHMDFLQPYFGRSIEVYGTESSIRWRDNEPIKIYNGKSDEWESIDATINWDHVYRDEIIHYLDCLKFSKKPIIDAADGLKMMQIIDACEKSTEQK